MQIDVHASMQRTSLGAHPNGTTQWLHEPLLAALHAPERQTLPLWQSALVTQSLPVPAFALLANPSVASATPRIPRPNFYQRAAPRYRFGQAFSQFIEFVVHSFPFVSVVVF
jgi:hypothetical protein